MTPKEKAAALVEELTIEDYVSPEHAKEAADLLAYEVLRVLNLLKSKQDSLENQFEYWLNVKEYLEETL